MIYNGHGDIQSLRVVSVYLCNVNILVVVSVMQHHLRIFRNNGEKWRFVVIVSGLSYAKKGTQWGYAGYLPQAQWGIDISPDMG